MTTQFIPREDHAIVHKKIVHLRDSFQVTRRADDKDTIGTQVRLNPNGTVFLSTHAYGEIGKSATMSFEDFYKLIRAATEGRL